MTKYKIENINTNEYLYNVLGDVDCIVKGSGPSFVLFNGSPITLCIEEDVLGTGSFHVRSGAGLPACEKLEDEFLRPLEPTTHELTLFEINHGIPYPLIPYLKCLSPTHTTGRIDKARILCL